MQPQSTCREESQADGAIHDVDIVSRELTALVGGELVRFDVPPGCLVVLRGEPVKLRLVQPGDCVRVRYAEVHGSRVARLVEVQTGQPPSWLSP